MTAYALSWALVLFVLVIALVAGAFWTLGCWVMTRLLLAINGQVGRPAKTLANPTPAPR